jgi:hypothetical protein
MGYTYLDLGPLVSWAIGHRTRRTSSATALAHAPLHYPNKRNAMIQARPGPPELHAQCNDIYTSLS